MSLLSQIVFDFYQDVYANYLVRTDNLLGFSNEYFNNPIMTPNFCISTSCKKEEFENHKNLLGRDSYWCNHFFSINNSYVKEKKKLMCLQFILELNQVKFKANKELSISIVSDPSDDLIEQYRLLVQENSYDLSISTQSKIHKVLKKSKANIEYLFCKFKDELIAGYLIVHGKKSSLFINAFVDFNYRNKGIVKEIHAKGVNHCLTMGQEAIFYWTFNNKLKNKGSSFEDLSVHSL